MDFSNESRNLQIANYLKTLRLEQNMTLEQLSDTSHIPIVHLTSIEDGRFNRFDDFYLKMYLKKYTQTLGVSLQQLYAYAMQQPIEDLPKQKKEESAETVIDPDSMQHKVKSQPTAIETPSRKKQKPQVKRIKPTISSPLGPTQIKPKINIGKSLIGLLLVVLIGAFLFFIVDFFRNIGNQEDTPEDPPQTIELPPELNLDPDGDDTENGEADETEVDEPETEPDPGDETTVEPGERIGNTQHFFVVALHSEIELRIEHSVGHNWIGGFLNGTEIINTTYQDGDIFEESVTVENDNVFRLTFGNIQAVEAFFINDVEVNFLSDGITGAENLEFTITIQSDE